MRKKTGSRLYSKVVVAPSEEERIEVVEDLINRRGRKQGGKGLGRCFWGGQKKGRGGEEGRRGRLAFQNHHAKPGAAGERQTDKTQRREGPRKNQKTTNNCNQPKME